ncbi:MAG: hypothetical protein U0625_10000 [Phycisphaerales bacterium]
MTSIDATHPALRRPPLGLSSRHANVLAWASALCCAASAAAHQDGTAATPPGAAPHHSTREQSAAPARFEPPQLFFDVAVPGELTAAEVDRWIDALRMDDAAAVAVRATAQAYLATQSRAYGEVFGATYQQAAEVAASGGPDSSPGALDRFRSLLAERRSALRRFVAMEERLFSEIAGRLPADEDVAVVDAMRQLRRRSRCSEFPCDLPMADLDLRILAATTGAARAVAPGDQDRWRTALLGYDTELAALHEKRVERRLESVLQDAESRQRLGGDLRALLDDRTARLASKLKPERAIIAANRRWADALAALLSPDAADAFRSAIDAKLFPTLYPNPYELGPVVRSAQALARSSAESETLRRVSEDLDAEAAKVALLAKQVEAKITDLVVSEARSIVVPADRDQMAEELRRLEIERRAAARRAIAICDATPELASQPAVEALRRSCTQAEAGKGK